MQRTVLSASPSSFGGRFDRNNRISATFSPSSYEDLSSRRSSLDISGNNAVAFGNRPTPIPEGASRAKNTSPAPTIGFAKPPLKDQNRNSTSSEQTNNVVTVRGPAPGLLSLSLGNAITKRQTHSKEGYQKRKYPVFHSEVVIGAYELACRAHAGHVRKNGDPVLVHCVETAKLLADLEAGEHIIAAALLHDVVDDTSLTFTELKSLVPADVYDLVKKVSKLSYMSQLVRNGDEKFAESDWSKLKDLMMASVDCRAVLIKMSDRIHNLKTLSALSLDKQCHWAQETMDLFVPLAGRLGCWSLKSEMEDLSFAILYPEAYEKLKSEYHQKLNEFTENELKEVLNELKTALDSSGLVYEDLSGRPKNLYGVFDKMMRKQYSSIDQITDLFALRIVLQDDEDCYQAQKIVHELWNHLPSKTKDYIKSPKENGYRSLHDVCLVNGKIPFEVQIRTSKMQDLAEHGVAAHWRYKEETESNSLPSEYVEMKTLWSRYVLNWVFELNDRKIRPHEPQRPTSQSFQSIWKSFWSFESEERGFVGCQHGVKGCPWSSIYVLVQDEDKLQVCETPMHSNFEEFLLEHVGILKNKGQTPLVNGEQLSPSYKLQFGDLIEFSSHSLGNSDKTLIPHSLECLSPTLSLGESPPSMGFPRSDNWDYQSDGEIHSFH